MKFLKKLQNSKSVWFLTIASFLFFLLRLPSLFEPYWYGDEGIYQVIGFALRKGRLLYSGIWDNKPPLLYYIYAAFNGNQEAVKLFSLIIGILTLIAFYFLAKRIFANLKTTMIATSLFAFLFSIPVLEGNIANAENFMLLPIILAMIFIQTINNKKLFIAGFLLGITFLIKIVAIFDLGALIVFIFITTYKNVSFIKGQIKNLCILLLGFFVPLILISFWFFIKGNLLTFIISAFNSNVSYVAYGNQLIIPQGFLIIKLILLSSCIIFLFLKRSSLSKRAIFVTLWFCFSIFNAFFSQRPYTHYVLVTIASFSLFAGLIITEKKYSLKLFSFGLICFLTIVFYFSLQKSFSNKIFGYYANFIEFIIGAKDTLAYRNYFDSAVPRNYAVATFINSHKNDGNIFIWGDDAQIYRLTNSLPPGRFIVAYHINSSQKNLNETYSAFIKSGPKYVIILPKQNPFPYPLSSYKESLFFDETIIYEKIF